MAHAEQRVFHADLSGGATRSVRFLCPSMPDVDAHQQRMVIYDRAMPPALAACISSGNIVARLCDS
jgi:hypothetical protein